LLADLWRILTENFNNREIAGTIWLLLACGFFFLKVKELRRSLLNFFRAILDARLLAVFGCFAGCVALLAWMGNNLGFWVSGATGCEKRVISVTRQFALVMIGEIRRCAQMIRTLGCVLRLPKMAAFCFSVMDQLAERAMDLPASASSSAN
jgi:hypothetical protein